MQQISSKQLKCYGRRNRAKPETTTSSLESGPPAVGDVRGGSTVWEEVQAPAAASVRAAEVAVALAAKPQHAGRGRPRKVVGGPKQGTAKSASDVGKQNVPTTRSSAGRLVAPEAREVARDSTPVEESVSEESSLKTTVVVPQPQPQPQPQAQAQAQAQAQVQERAPVRVRIVGPFSNGGSKHGRNKSLGSGSPGSGKTRGQIARQEARRAANEETQGDAAQWSREKQSQGQADGEGNGEWQANYERGAEGNASGERKDGGEQVVLGKGDEGQGVSESGAIGMHERERKEQVVERKDAGKPAVLRQGDEGQGVSERRAGGMHEPERKEQVVERRAEGRGASDSMAGGGSQREGEDAVEQTMEAREEGVGGKSRGERKDAAEQSGMGRRDGGQSVAEKRVGGKSLRERRDAGNSGRDREGSGGAGNAQGTLASRRRLLALQKRQREEVVLAQADDVVLKQEYLEANKDKKGLAKSKEAARAKTHWDFVIEEMTWLAKDFERERKWKLSQAKKVALRVNRSKLDVVARENRRLKEEEQRMRRVASNIAKDVKKFWLKVDKLVSYKQQLLVEERKKKALDKHLDFLLGQTERYSTMLAENLADTTNGQEPESIVLLPAVPTKDGLNGGGDGGVASAASESVEGGWGDDLDGAVGMVMEGGVDVDFMVDDGEEQEDDEATLEADEALITEDERKEELSALQRESELPLEDLLNAYKLMRGDSGSQSEEEEDEEEEEGDEDDGSGEGEEASEGGGGAVGAEVTVGDESKKDPVSRSEGAGAVPSDGGAVGEADSAEGRLGLGSGGHAAVDDADYVPAPLADGGDEDDDEGTLEEEERMAEEEGDGNANEIDLLRVESSMPLEDLLAKYRSDMQDGLGDSQEFWEDRRDRTSEAGTSGSGSEEDSEADSEADSQAEYISEVRERMGEPSTSGREHGGALAGGMNGARVIEAVEVKQEMVEAKSARKDVGAGGKMEVHGRVLYSSEHYSRRNGLSEAGCSKDAVLATGLLLGGGDEVDAATAAAVAKVSEAARRRGDRMMMRHSKEVSGRGTEGGAVVKTGEAGESEARDEELCPATTSVAVGEHADVGGALSIGVSEAGRVDGAVANGAVAGAAESVADDGGLRGRDDAMKGVVEGGGEVVPVDGSRDGSAGAAKDDGGGEAEKVDVGEEKKSEDRLADFAAAAQSAQPTGYTFSTTKVKTKLPFLLKHSLREYQHIGLDWLVTMYEKRLNGILADEMGLGKTIMTIALLAHLACEKGIWGPHLIVVPTSVMLNWETEFMKWCPAFKILTYFGSAKERKLKRQGWSRGNSFHVCITTYRLVIQDAKAFKRKKWKYLILDEAHLIKNWKSQRWQTLLNFNSKRRILLTGTPLQNDLMELWSLMHFLMPHVFQSHQEFRDWFSNPITGMVEGQDQVNKELVDRLHNVLRPFLLRRLKKDVEKQLPGKFEHVIRCRLSKRQRNLYEDFMASSDTQATLSSGNFLGLINVLMQLRKVCNHPDLFEGRPIVSSFDMPDMEVHLSSAACSAMRRGPMEGVDAGMLNLQFGGLDGTMSKWEAEEVGRMKTPGPLIVELASTGEDSWKQQQESKVKASREVRSVMEEIGWALREESDRRRKERVVALWAVNELRCGQRPVYGADVLKRVEVRHPVDEVHRAEANPRQYLEFSSVLSEMVQLPMTRCERVMDLVTAFMFAIPAARAPVPVAWCSRAIGGGPVLSRSVSEEVLQEASSMLVALRPVVVRRQLFFPDRRLLQFDCGKLQELAVLLRRLKSEGHRALIFTQMTKMLDVLESFINLYGYTYMRLDGSTKPEQRQILMQRFNTNPKIFLFILSTRSGGVGINLVGADTVIFYDSDWNPAMDLQAQDRCHRIGQTREVHIYRLISESTIEENILKKANQKRILDDLVIQSGSYNTEFFKKLDPMELFSGLKGVKVGEKRLAANASAGAGSGAGTPDASSLKAFEGKELSSAEVEAALKNAEDEADYMAMKRVEQEEAAENQEFTEELVAGNLDDEDLADELDEQGRSGRGAGEVGVMGGGAGGERGVEESGAVVVAESSMLGVGESSMLATDADEEMDMLADVRQMAAAAAASGRGSGSFEDQLRPVERYAMRFLEVWDPRVDNMAVVAQVAFEEKEWELDQLEKLKEEQEAEIDEDNEPLYYETWDTALADEAYRQQVDILAQQQEQKQLEWEAMEEEMRDADRALAAAAATVRGAENFGPKPRGRKKLKKAKFKSLTEGSLMSDTEEENVGGEYEVERGGDPSYRDVQSEMMGLPHRSPSQRKRKAPKLLEEELSAEKHSKKLKKDHLGKGKTRTLEASLFRTIFGISSDPKTSGGGEAGGLSGSGGGATSGGKERGGKLMILGLPAKKGPLVMLEKERKKDSVRSVEHLPAASAWTHAEDAVLCAVVHEYGGNWALASDALAGVRDGGVYRGRHRHPVHCRERFRQLLAQNAAAASGDPTSEKSALSAATNAQLKVTEEHTKRLLDAVLQLPDEEFLLQRHFVAVLAAVKNSGMGGVQQGSEEQGRSGGTNGPGGHGFVQLRSLVKSHAASSKIGAGKLSPREVVSAALAQAERDDRGVPEQANAKVHGKEQVSKDAGVAGENQGFSAAQFLVGSAEYGESGAMEGERVLQAQGESAAVRLEELLGWALTSPSGHPTPKGGRKLAEMLVENRFRFATRIGWDGATRDWAAAGGSGTGVLGLHIPSKGRVVGKKRPAPDPSKPPKAKMGRTSKADAKKGHAESTGEEARAAAGVNGEDSDVPGGHDGDANRKEVEAEAASGRKAPFAGKIVVKRPKKNVVSSAAPTSPRGSGRLDSIVSQLDSRVAGGKVSKSGKKSGPRPGADAAVAVGVSGAGAGGADQRTDKKSGMKGSQCGQGTNSGTGCVPGGGLGNSGGDSTSSAGRELKGGGGGTDVSSGRGIDLNGSSDDDVTIVGVSAGGRFRAGGSESAVAGPGRRLKLPRERSEGTKAGGRGQSEEPSLAASRSSGMGYGGAVQNEDSSLASHLMTRLAGSPGVELLTLGGAEVLSQVQWPPAAGAWPVASLNEDLDLSTDVGSVLFSEVGRLKSMGGPLRSSPPGQAAGRSMGRGASSPLVGRLQSSEGATRSGSSEEEQRGQTAAWMVGSLQRQVPSIQGGQGAGRSNDAGSEVLRPVLRLGPSSPVRPGRESGPSSLNQVHSRGGLSSSSRGGIAGLGGRPGARGGQQAYQGGAFAGLPAQSLASPESPVDTGLGLGLGSGGRYNGRDKQARD